MAITMDPIPSSSGDSIPPRTAILTKVTQQTALLSQLFTSLTQPATASSPFAPPIHQASLDLYSQIARSDDEISNLTRDVWAHQKAWKELERKKKEVQDLDAKVRQMIMGLEKSRRELEILVVTGKEVEETIDRVTKNPLPVPQILSHARALAKHSSAPVSHLLSDVDKAQYQPWPTETAMRAGILFREGGGSMSGLGDIGVMGEEQAQKQSQYMDVEDHYVHQEAQPNVSHGHVFDLDLNSDDSDEG